jgi:hypothetical protein
MGAETFIIRDGKGNKANIDRASGSIQMIDYAHHEIHEGDTYSITGQVTLASGNVKDFLFAVPTSETAEGKRPHIVATIRSSGEANFMGYEGTVTSSLGGAITAFNHDRGSSNTSAITVSNTPTMSTTGTAIFEQHFGGGQNIPGTGRAENEWILAHNTNYLFTIKSEAASNDVSWTFNWYEHADTVVE